MIGILWARFQHYEVDPVVSMVVSEYLTRCAQFGAVSYAHLDNLLLHLWKGEVSG